MKYFLLSYILIGLTSCRSYVSVPEPQDHLRPPPDDFLFGPIRDKIDSLDHASKSEWKSAAGSSNEIESLDELKQVTVGLVFTECEWCSIMTDYKRAASATHFGFDANYHALVFFDASDRPIRVEKW